MQSYIAAPQIHANAVMNPRMSGGPFIDYGGKRVREIQALFDQTVAHRSYLLELSKPLNEVLDRCRIPARYCPVVERFFTTEKPKRYSRYGGEGMRWRYFGHACILLETPRLSFLFDPVLSYTYDSSISRYTYDDLPDKIDYVLITHNHQDHLLFETMLQLRHKIECVIVPRNGAGLLHDPSLKLILEAIGFKNVIELDEMQNVKFDGGYLTSLPFLVEHADLSVRTKLAYLG